MRRTRANVMLILHCLNPLNDNFNEIDCFNAFRFQADIQYTLPKVEYTTP